MLAAARSAIRQSMAECPAGNFGPVRRFDHDLDRRMQRACGAGATGFAIDCC